MLLLGREEMDACQAKTQPNQIVEINYANVHGRKVLTVIPKVKMNLLLSPCAPLPSLIQKIRVN